MALLGAVALQLRNSRRIVQIPDTKEVFAELAAGTFQYFAD